MDFETKLHELYHQYSHFPEADKEDELRHFVTDVFQAREVEFKRKTKWDEKNYCQFQIVAPGLATYWGSESHWREDAVMYGGRNGEKALEPKNNGYVIVYLQCLGLGKDTEFTEVRLQFSDCLAFPEYAIKADKNRGRYRHEAAQGEFFAMWDDDVYASYNSLTKKGEWEDKLRIHLSPTLRCDKIYWIGVKTENLGSGILTDFFNDVGYNGLDKLIEK